MSRRTLGVAALLAAAFVAGLLLQRTTGEPAPAVSAIRFSGLDGASHALGDYAGQLVLVNFWGTWCEPCRAEIPLLAEAQKTYGARGLQVLGPAMDRIEAVRDYLERQPLPYPVFVGDAGIADAMNALGDTRGGLPYSVLISPAGKVLHRQTGEFERDELRALIERHLK